MLEWLKWNYAHFAYFLFIRSILLQWSHHQFYQFQVKKYLKSTVFGCTISKQDGMKKKNF